MTRMMAESGMFNNILVSKTVTVKIYAKSYLVNLILSVLAC